ncbi:hypothetical protein [Methylomonas sp. LWB]|uniref:hypothetical protein n=1 Tax=Methylomonas sp. LWB TaxID=1905845 RepID=UPI000B27EF01|nr:hypothetical protein [Methylomonas sp. LWB]
MKTLSAAALLLSSTLTASPTSASVISGPNGQDFGPLGCDQVFPCDVLELTQTLFGGKHGTLISLADDNTDNDNLSLNFDYRLDTVYIERARLRVWLRDDTRLVADALLFNSGLLDTREYAAITSINGEPISADWVEVDGLKQYLELDITDFLSLSGANTFSATLGVMDTGSRDYLFAGAEFFVKYCDPATPIDNGGIGTVPLPGAIWLMGSALLGIGAVNTKSRRKT